ncbi:MAG: hypothetical protein Q9220_005816 [cf. Caloplaca sp. 1 TL-2023]
MSTGKSGRWTEAEKAALMASIVASLGTVNWSKVQLPAGRSRMACWHVYNAVMQEAKGITMGDNNNAGAVKKRGPKQPSPAKVDGASKRKRGPKTQRENPLESDGEEEPHGNKKLKAELQSDDDYEAGPKLQVEEV